MRITGLFGSVRVQVVVAVTTASVIGGMVADSAAQSTPVAAIEASGTVRVCDANGDFIDSDGDQYGLEGNTYLKGPPPSFDNSAYACRGRPQRFDVSQIADPEAAGPGTPAGAPRGAHVGSSTSINVEFEPEFTEVVGQATFTIPVCLGVGPGAPVNPAGFPRIGFLAEATASRSHLKECLGDLGQGPGVGPCSSVRARLSLGNRGFLDRFGDVVPYFEFIELTTPHLADRDGVVRLRQVAKLVPGLGGIHVEGGVSATIKTAVAGTPLGNASGDVRFYMETMPWVGRVKCPFSTDVAADAADAAAPLEFLPKPAWWIDAGDAVPDDFTLAISPPTGPITMNQAFDLAVIANTGGATVTGLTGTIDGLNVSGPLAVCLAPNSALGGLVQGTTFKCGGLSGRFLAGIFGTGAHTIAITASLSDGRTISGAATWTIKP